MASYKLEVCLAANHQAKVVRHAKGNAATQSFTVVAETGIVLAYLAVLNEDMMWVDKGSMVEIVERHGDKVDPNNPHRLLEQGSLPDRIYLDKDCCNGKEGGRTEQNKYFYGMVKVLDGFHAITRIGREINSEHDRKKKFMSQESDIKMHLHTFSG